MRAIQSAGMSRRKSHVTSMRNRPGGLARQTPLDRGAVGVGATADRDHAVDHVEAAIGEALATDADVSLAVANFHVDAQLFMLDVEMGHLDPRGHPSSWRRTVAIIFDLLDAHGQNVDVGEAGQGPGAAQLADRVHDAGIGEQQRQRRAGEQTGIGRNGQLDAQPVSASTPRPVMPWNVGPWNIRCSS